MDIKNSSLYMRHGRRGKDNGTERKGTELPGFFELTRTINKTYSFLESAKRMSRKADKLLHSVTYDIIVSVVGKPLPDGVEEAWLSFDGCEATLMFDGAPIVSWLIGMPVTDETRKQKVASLSPVVAEYASLFLQQVHRKEEFNFWVRAKRALDQVQRMHELDSHDRKLRPPFGYRNYKAKHQVPDNYCTWCGDVCDCEDRAYWQMMNS